jgi:hypothetical protein
MLGFNVIKVLNAWIHRTFVIKVLVFAGEE